MAVKASIDMVSIMRAGLSSGRGAKYKRLAEAIEHAVVAGEIEPGCKLPPHRRLADSLGVTIGTVSRAYAELERLGRVVARVGDGTYIRQGAMERQRDAGFRTAGEEPGGSFDMSRNVPIPGQESVFMAQSLRQLASDPALLAHLSGYTAEAGSIRYRAAGAHWLSHGDFVAQADQIICVNGGQHGLLCSLMALLKAGDTLVTEQLTYPGLITVARMLGIKLIGVAMDEEGLLPSALDEVCRAHRVSALYCTPTIQNPTTAVLSTSRRRSIAQVCQAHNLLILEDEAHAMLVPDRPLPLSFFAPQRTVLLGSLSKSVASGLRAGYLHAPQALIPRLAAAVRSTCWMATPLTMELATIWIEQGIAAQLLEQQIAEIGRRKALVEGLLGGLVYQTQPGSPHFWIEVPQPWRASQVEQELRDNSYLIATAETFAVGQSVVPQFVRASVCNGAADDQRLREGFAALAEALGQGGELFGE